MKKRYLLVAFVLMFFGIEYSEALVIDNCKVLASFKRYSSLDETKYICKGETFGKNTDDIYYSGQGNIVKINNFNAFYFTNYADLDIILDITGVNNISLLHINKGVFEVTGEGTLKFKEDSFVKKVVNGEAIYQVEYNGKVIIGKDKNIYEGTIKEFEDDYQELLKYNKISSEYKKNDYEFLHVADYTKMTSVVVTESWINKHVKTNLSTSVGNGFGLIQYVENKEKLENNTLEKDNVVLISDKKVNTKYELEVNDLKEKEIGKKVQEILEDLELVGFYDLTVYNGKNEVSMKDGTYTIKIKVEEDVNLYEDLQIIYVNDDGDIEEYIEASLEDGYIVFKTSHLSHYGIIGTQRVNDITVEIEEKNNVFIDIVKISFLVLISLVFLVIIVFLIVKGNFLPKRKKRKRVRA